MDELIIRPMHCKDLDSVSNAIFTESQNGNMLAKSKTDLIAKIRQYCIAEINGEIAGFCGWKPWCTEHAEIVSLFVFPKFRRQGIAGKLIQECLEIAQACGFKMFFALTTAENVFIKSGFKKSAISLFPEKILNDCARCPRNFGSARDPRCHEVLMAKT